MRWLLRTISFQSSPVFFGHEADKVCKITKTPLSLFRDQELPKAWGPKHPAVPPSSEKWSEIRVLPSDYFSFSQIPGAFIRTRPWPAGARENGDLFHHRHPFTTSKDDHIPAVCSPVTASSGWGEGWARRATGHFCSLSPFPASSGPLPLKGASPAVRERLVVCTIPDAGLGGPGPSKRPAFVFLSKVKKNNNNPRGSDDEAKDGRSLL